MGLPIQPLNSVSDVGVPFSSDKSSQAGAVGKKAGDQYRQLRRILRRPLPTFLLDVDTIEGKLSGRDERDSDHTDYTTMENVLMGHGGLVAGYNRGISTRDRDVCCVSVTSSHVSFDVFSTDDQLTGL
jgi:hypothetical protein